MRSMSMLISIAIQFAASYLRYAEAENPKAEPDVLKGWH
jgi:hypothetical protein